MDTNPLIEPLKSQGEKLVEENISKDEEILAKLRGDHGQALIITKKRLYVLKWGFSTGNMFGGKCNAFDYKRITGIEIKKGLLLGTVEILTASTQNTQKSWGGKAMQADNMITFQKDRFGQYQEVVNLVRNLISEE